MVGRAGFEPVTIGCLYVPARDTSHCGLKTEIQDEVQTAFASVTHKKFSTVKRMVDFEFAEKQDLFQKLSKNGARKACLLKKQERWTPMEKFLKSYSEAWANWV